MSYLTFFFSEKLPAGLADNEGLISPKSEEIVSQGVGVGGSTFAEVVDYFLR